MKQVLITGSSSGIGDGLARFLSSRNNRVFGVSRRENFRLNKCASYNHVFLDLTDEVSVKSELSNLFQTEKSWDLVILNAGVLGDIGDMKDVSIEKMKSVFEINLWTNKIIMDVVQESGIEVKQVVAISSGAAVNGSRGWNAYSMSKAALNMMIQLYAREMENVHFSALAPGLVDTAMQSYISDFPVDERFPSLDRLKAARGTELMPRPLELAPRLLDAMEKVKLEYPSGSFVDIREMRLKDY